MFRLPRFTQQPGAVLGQLRHTLIGKARELAGRLKHARAQRGAEADPLRPVIELHPAIQRRLRRKFARYKKRLNPLGLVALSLMDEQAFLDGLMERRRARQAHRAAQRARFNPGGNAHQRRLRRRAVGRFRAAVHALKVATA